MTKITCPYCSREIQVPTPSSTQVRGVHTVCECCHKPIVVYPCRTALLLHQDRSIKAVAVDVLSYVKGVFLEVMESPLAHHQELQIPEGKSMIGKQNSDSETEVQILTDDLDLMRNHASLRLKPDLSLMVKDNASRAGTFVNGERLSKNEWRRLSSGDVLLLGATACIVHLPEDEDDDYLFFED